MNGRATWRRAFVPSGRAGKPTTPLPRARPFCAQPIIESSCQKLGALVKNGKKNSPKVVKSGADIF